MGRSMTATGELMWAGSRGAATEDMGISCDACFEHGTIGATAREWIVYNPILVFCVIRAPVLLLSEVPPCILAEKYTVPTLPLYAFSPPTHPLLLRPAPLHSTLPDSRMSRTTCPARSSVRKPASHSHLHGMPYDRGHLHCHADTLL